MRQPSNQRPELAGSWKGLDAMRRVCWLAPLRGVMPMIEQHIAQGAMYFERRAQWTQVIATVQNFALALEEPVGELADSGTDTLHPTGDRVIGVRFD